MNLSEDTTYYLAFPRTAFDTAPDETKNYCSGNDIELPEKTAIRLVNKITWPDNRFGERWLARTKFKITVDSKVDGAEETKKNYYLYISLIDVDLKIK